MCHWSVDVDSLGSSRLLIRELQRTVRDASLLPVRDSLFIHPIKSQENERNL
jgi:hypothetical protein